MVKRLGLLWCLDRVFGPGQYCFRIVVDDLSKLPRWRLNRRKHTATINVVRPDGTALSREVRCRQSSAQILAWLAHLGTEFCTPLNGRAQEVDLGEAGQLRATLLGWRVIAVCLGVRCPELLETEDNQ